MIPFNKKALLAFACAAVLPLHPPSIRAQSSSPAPATAPAEKKIALIPGLDKELMDTSADPCVDFARYSCGNFSKLYPIPPDESRYGSDGIVFDYTQNVLHELLEKVSINSAQRTANEQKIGDFFATCMDDSAVDSEGLRPLQAELDRISALTGKAELTGLLAHDQMMDVSTFFRFGEQQDSKDAQKQIAVVDQGGLGLPERDYYFRSGDAAEITRREYVEHVANMLHLMGEPAAKAAAEAARIMEIETALARVSMDVTSRRDPYGIYHPMTVSKLAELTPQIDWPRFFADTGAPAISDLNVANPDFFKGLQTVLDATDLDTIKAYLRWHLVNSIPGWGIPMALDDEDFDFYRHKLRGQPQQQVRWKRCVDATDGALGEALGQVYVAENFPASSKAYTLQMVHEIEAAMDKEIDAQDWMSSETKVKARAKLHQVADKIGYPDHWRDYSSLAIVRGDAIGNIFRAADFENKRELAKIGMPVDRGEWKMTPPTVNAYYNPRMNDINFPAGILQSPFYDPSASDAVNYGQIGGVIGHELTHGFDDRGSEFDAGGNLSNWWSADDRKKFDAMTDCEVSEYGNFTAVDDVKVNGKLTLGENTADNGGLRLAYIALLADAKQKGIDLNAAQGGYTPLQQFFIGYGQSWCANIRPAIIRLQVQTDPHAPDSLRVNGVVQNMPEFGKAFGCKTGQPMLPANACHVW